MKVGTIETEVEEPERTRRRSRPTSSGTSGSRGGGNGGSEDGGDDGGSTPLPRSEANDINRDKSRLIVGFLLLVVLMTFGGLVGAYIVIATNQAIEWTPFDLPYQIWLSTVIIVASSVTYEFARRSVVRDLYPHVRRFLAATTALGGFFIASQLVVWMQLVGRGFYMRGNPYAGFFYILTAAHAIHVLGGIIALGSILLRSWYPTSSNSEFEYRRNLATAVGWYWHFMGILWVALFVLLGFWK